MSSVSDPSVYTASAIQTSAAASSSSWRRYPLLVADKEPNIREQIARTFFRGSSAFDAWLTACTAQVAQVLLTLPYSFAQLGLVSGIVLQLLYAFLGCWSCYMTTSLYADYARKLERQNSRREDHMIQWYEVLDGLLGTPWKIAGLIFNCVILVSTATIQIIACGNTVWYINDNLDKRTWTCVFGAVSFFIILVPDARYYRAWTFVGIFMTTYTAWYMTISAIFYEKAEKVTYSGPINTVQYFAGGTNILYTFGGHAITLEIMAAMHKPVRFNMVYLYAVFYILTLTIPSAVSVYWRFGDKMLHNSNALAVFQRTRFRDAAVVLMLAHQFNEIGVLSLPIFFLWEKLIGIHHSNHYIVKSLARTPVLMLMLFIAIMVPFFGPINSVIGAVFTSFGVYIFPCIAFMYARRDPNSRKKAVEQPPSWLWRSWVPMYCICLGTILWVAIIGMGFGVWTSIKNLMNTISTFGLFAKCYQCSRRR